MVGNGDRQGRAFFGIGRRAEFIQQHQRLRSRGARDEINIGDVRGESGKILLDRLVVADIGQHGIEHRQLRAVGRHGNAGLRHQRQQPSGFQADGFAAGVWAGDDQLPRSASSSRLVGITSPPFDSEIPFQQRMPGIVQQNDVLHLSADSSTETQS